MPLGLRLISDLKRMVASLAVFLMLFSLLVLMNPEIAEANSPNGLPDQIILSITDDPQTNQTIAWRAADDTSQRVQYLPVAGFNNSFNDAREVTAVKTDLSDGYYHFETTLSGLSRDTKYIYRVGNEETWSEPAYFTTATCSDQFSFLYLGDVQEGHEGWGEMLKRIVTENPGLKFALLGGDLVNEGNSNEEWELFFNAASPVFKNIPLIPAAGNHDDTPLFWNSFALPENGPEGFKEEFYSFDYGNCHIAVLNSNKMGASASHYNVVKSWLQNDLESSNQQWKFLVFHYPPYPVVDDGHSYNLQQNWVPLFDQCGVDIVFVGHQHVYMRTKPLRDGQVQADGDGIVYIMGNSGSKFYPPGDNHDYIAYQEANISNYQIITIDGDTFAMTARNAVGQEIDSYTLSKQTLDNLKYLITPKTDTAYNVETTPSGVSIITLNNGISGMRYFSVEISPVEPHEGRETAVFIHLRNGAQLSLAANRADFDQIDAAQAGFNVQPGDIIKVYIVDDLTNVFDSSQ